MRLINLLMEVDVDPVRRKHGLSVQQAALELGVHKSTASRLLRTLVEHRYAVPNDGRRGYRLGSAMRRYSALSLEHQHFKEFVRPFLVRLVEQTGECAHAAVATAEHALVVDDVETGHPLRVVAKSGRRVPLHCTSAGKCLLAFGLAEIPKSLPQRTFRTITNEGALRLHLDEIRERGYAFDDEENDVQVRCISAPVFDGSREALGCIGIDGPVVRMTPEQIPSMIQQVVEIAQQVSTALDVGDPNQMVSAPTGTAP